MPDQPTYPLLDRLPNGSVGKAYEVGFKSLFPDQMHADAVERIHVTLPPDCGLEFDEASQVLRGTPTLAGELDVDVVIVPRMSKKLSLTINPDPTSLWKDLPSDAMGLFAKPDAATRRLETPHLVALAASLRGRSHAHEGKYRDDDFVMRYLPDSGWHLFAVADGAGSAEFSRRGSQLACDTALQILESRLKGDPKLDTELASRATSGQRTADESLKRLLYDYVAKAGFEAAMTVSREAKNYGKDVRQFATTLLLTITKPLPEGWFVASFAIGDGGAGLLVDENALLPLTKPDSGDFGGQTVFLTSPKVFSSEAGADLMARVIAGFAPTFRLLSLMTDGVSDPKFESDANLGSNTAWEAFRAELAGIVDMSSLPAGAELTLLEWLKFPSPGNHDDRTIIIAVPKNDAQS